MDAIRRVMAIRIRSSMAISNGTEDRRTTRHRKLGPNSTPINIERTTVPSTRDTKNNKLEMHPTRRNKRRTAAYKMQRLGMRSLNK